MCHSLLLLEEFFIIYIILAGQRCHTELRLCDTVWFLEQVHRSSYHMIKQPQHQPGGLRCHWTNMLLLSVAVATTSYDNFAQ